MTITISPDVERLACERAAAEGVSVEDYVAQLIRKDEEELDDRPIDVSDPEFEEVRAAVMEKFEQAERGEGRAAEEVFAELRAKYDLSR